MLKRVFVGIGSNIHPERHIISALDAIATTGTPLRISPIYQCKPVGFDGDLFCNLVVEFQYPGNIDLLQDWLYQIEINLGKPLNHIKYQPRTIDLDILLVDDLIQCSPQIDIPRSDITQFAFVLKPLMDLAPDFIHPLIQLSIKDLWNSSQLNAFPLTECTESFKKELLDKLPNAIWVNSKDT
jgi:2-amino-4-hydroxy-6-hydroxymethyldihydropteridine diphosphokinase